MMSAQSIAKALFILLESGHSDDQVFSAFQQYIKKYRLEALVCNIVRYLEKFLENKKIKEQVVVITAHAVHSDILTEIQSFIRAPKDVNIVNVVDESVIAGFIARYHDVEHDASIASQLLQLKKAIIQN